MRFHSGLARVSALACGLAVAFQGGPALARSLAIAVGANAGDSDDPPLRFAAADARRVLETATAIGGVDAADAVLLLDPDAAALRAVLAATRARLVSEAWGPSDQLLLYASAHADTRELHLAGSRFPLEELRAFVESVPTGLAILVLDTCHAGAVTRAKGLRPLPGTEVVLERPPVKGRIVIASASPEEPAFESDGIGGSVFTHHWLAGLRGAADVSRDGQVSLHEAYGYAYARTIEASATLRGARQTPVFDLDLAGAGEVILSEPGRSRARLALDIEEPGEWVVSSLAGGLAVARFQKSAGPAQFVLEPGTYLLRARRGDRFLEGRVTVSAGSATRIGEADLRSFRTVAAGRKGTEAEWSLHLAGSFGTAAVGGLPPLVGWRSGVRWLPEAAGDFSRWGFQLMLAHRVGRPGDRSFVEREVDASLGVGLQWPLVGARVRLVGVGGALLVSQEGLSVGDRVGTQPHLDVEIGAEWGLPLDGVRLDAALNAGLLLVLKQSGWQPTALANGTVGLSWGW